ncbi:DUF4349 domain-containing protein [Halomarina oriensis]|uniref:DUF4349 domain-containing protein n=1 Tax=Halomarina oriensis TaxID=671145 RepID=A0A6B0GJM5_9EURY|nr:DUF4349 domain-containing protein [Halomarina oriensis]
MLVLVVLAGCGAGGDGAEGGGAGDVNYQDAGTAADGGGGGESGSASGGGDSAAQRESSDDGSATGSQSAARALVRTGQLRLEVDDYDATQATLTAAVEARGGYVADSAEEVREVGNETFTTGRVVFRVPSENFSGFVDSVEAEGETLSSETNTRDVTDQLVDLRARLDNARAERDRLRTLYESANETEDVLAVSEELSAAQERVERLEAQLASLEGRVAMSTVTVELREPRPESTTTETETPFADRDPVGAFLGSVDGVVVLGRSLVVGGAYALPYLLVVGVPVGVAAVVYRRVG